MEKPFSLKIQDFNDKLVELVNTSELPAYVLKIELEKIYQQIDRLEKEEIEKYKESDNDDSI